MEQQIATPVLNVPRVKHLLNVLNRISEIRETTIITRENEAEYVALNKEIDNAVIQHAGELLTSFLLCKTEYEVIIQAEAIKQRRATDINARVFAMQAQMAEQAAKQSNIVEIPKAK